MSVVNTTGQRWSDLKMWDRFRIGWEQCGLPGSDLTTEYVFHPLRSWRFDAAFPSQKLAVEFDGMGFGHQSIGRLKDNYEKRNAAVEMGWRVMVFESGGMSMKRLPDIIDQVCRTLARAPEPLAHALEQ